MQTILSRKSQSLMYRNGWMKTVVTEGVGGATLPILTLKLIPYMLMWVALLV